MKPIIALCVTLTFLTVVPAEPPTPPGPQQFSVEFRDKRWADVLDWVSQQSGLPFVGTAPTGNFTFVPPAGKTFTSTEITAILNEALAVRGLVLQFGEQSFTVVPIGQGQPVERKPAPERKPPTTKERIPAPTTERIPEPAPKRAPEPAPKRAPAPTPERAPTPAPERAPSRPLVELIEVGNVEPAKAAQTLRAMFNEMHGTYVEPDAARSAVLVRGTPEQIAEFKIALRVLEMATPKITGGRVITLETGSAADLGNEIARMIRQLRKDLAVRVVAPGQELPKDAPKDPAKTITLLTSGNRLLLVGENAEALAMANEIARLYTTAKGKDGDFVVLRLKHAEAVSAAKLLDETFNGPPGDKRPAERVRVVADPASNSLLVRASPVDLLTIRRLLQTHVDSGEEHPSVAAETFLIGPLKHAKAAELANLVREVYRNDKPARGFTATADPRTNTLVLRCDRTLFEDAKRVVQQLDMPVDAKKK